MVAGDAREATQGPTERAGPIIVRRPFKSSVFDRGALDLDVGAHEARARDVVVTARSGARWTARVEEALGGRVLRMLDPRLGAVLGIFELAFAAELGADACTYVEDIGGVRRALRVVWSSSEATELDARLVA